MAELLIRNERLAWRILDIARRENRTVEDVLEKMVNDYSLKPSDKPAPGMFATLAESARRAEIGIDSELVDTSERSREILETEFGEYLRKRLDEQSNSD